MVARQGHQQILLMVARQGHQQTLYFVPQLHYCWGQFVTLLLLVGQYCRSPPSYQLLGPLQAEGNYPHPQT